MKATIMNPASKEFKAAKKAAKFSKCGCTPAAAWWKAAWGAAKEQGFDGLLGLAADGTKVLFQRRGDASEVLVLEI